MHSIISFPLADFTWKVAHQHYIGDTIAAHKSNMMHTYLKNHFFTATKLYGVVKLPHFNIKKTAQHINA
jgi:hypothetical protein